MWTKIKPIKKNIYSKLKNNELINWLAILILLFEGIHMQLFFVKKDPCKTWKRLASTDLNLNFIQVFELYQIRWSIKVFFNESKQYMRLGKCQSQDFDAQVCSTTISMITFILLCYHKRTHYEQKLNGLFEDIAYQSLEI